MYRVPTSLFALFASALLAQAAGITKQDAPKPDPWTTVAADPLVTVLSSAVPAKWVLVDDVGSELRVHGDGKSASFAAGRPGEYRLLVIDGESVQRIKIVVGKLPEPPAPGPGPAPVVPDALVGKFQTAFDSDARSPEIKAKELASLNALYVESVAFANLPEVTSTGDLVGAVQRAARLLKVEGLAELRKAIGSDLASTIGTDDVPLGAENRKIAASAFKKVAEALAKVK